MLFLLSFFFLHFPVVSRILNLRLTQIIDLKLGVDHAPGSLKFEWLCLSDDALKFQKGKIKRWF